MLERNQPLRHSVRLPQETTCSNTLQVKTFVIYRINRNVSNVTNRWLLVDDRASWQRTLWLSIVIRFSAYRLHIKHACLIVGWTFRSWSSRWLLVVNCDENPGFLQLNFGCRTFVSAKWKRVASPLIFNEGILVDISTILFLNKQIFSTK